MKTKTILLLTLAAGVISIHAQSGDPFAIKSFTIDSGGGASSGGSFTMRGTAGQPDVGALAGGSFKIEGGFWSSITVTQTPGAPLLKIRLIAGPSVVLSWPVSALGFMLEYRTNAVDGLWTPEPTAVIKTATEHTVTVPAAERVRCYRLIK